MHSRVRFSGCKFAPLCLLAAMLFTAMTGLAQNALSGLLVTGKIIPSPPLGNPAQCGQPAHEHSSFTR